MSPIFLVGFRSWITKLSMNKKTVITGIGVVSPIGIGHQDFWKNLVSGNSGITPMESLDLSKYECKNGAEVKNLDPAEFLGRKGLRYLHKGTKFLASSIKLALDDANLNIDDEISSRTGILIGTSLGNFSQTTDYFHDIVREEPSELSPMQSYDVALNSSINYASVFFKIKGFARTISSGFTSGIDAIGNAHRLIQNGKADVIIAGGVEQISLDLYMIFLLRKMLSGSHGADSEISMPFDKRRNGFIMSEGSYVFVMEELDFALSRGAKVYGEVSGFGTIFAGNKKYDTGRRVEKAQSAMKACMDDANISLQDLDLIQANGNSGRLSDHIEAQAIFELFEKRGDEIPVCAVKSIVGECYGASGAMQTAATALAIQNSLIPPTINCEEKDPECNVNIIHQKQACKINTALVNSFDYTGNNSCLMVKKL
ncbi:MAG: beta-ketoacyl-[acyl-carrier-protein] synthase family protein [Candidatus Scalindua sp. AMX11]|nr:MAG: beta-ketoacyl-[acyl-carrier-protein] synthase family protein [Candidatus Scalindua sp.]NOG86009.1 beta-ketoacyl-[acyl-carrier-protein] synthase family protein [Planctomycetota bacterium]RZV91362.1 MAG: beta-ketoacyl-[acyl-carrier-protein] synthase family protein [Candidatus Scalindua sp. SCAELEC01]TDE65919.1 MAG: beta-ketoacyl-[acyl-carrier-protein] synthase family protein [Candidatus Scalindua sp. AMX11]GJQ59222.1 MAG: 3-oxoacyl-[acyl-carrier-protein] synthase 2 [Candidatus Scalindua s